MVSKHRTREQRHLQWLLRSIRQEAKLTQAELADHLGKPQSYVSKYESGERRLDIPEIEAICTVLNVDLGEFTKRYKSR